APRADDATLPEELATLDDGPATFAAPTIEAVLDELVSEQDPVVDEPWQARSVDESPEDLSVLELPTIELPILDAPEEASLWTAPPSFSPPTEPAVYIPEVIVEPDAPVLAAWLDGSDTVEPGAPADEAPTDEAPTEETVDALAHEPVADPQEPAPAFQLLTPFALQPLSSPSEHCEPSHDAAPGETDEATFELDGHLDDGSEVQPEPEAPSLPTLSPLMALPTLQSQSLTTPREAGADSSAAGAVQNGPESPAAYLSYEPGAPPAGLPKLASVPISMADLLAAEAESAPSFGEPAHNLAAVDIWQMVDVLTDDTQPDSQQLVTSGSGDKRSRGWLRGRKG
ncbi:MAG: hypothetical protein WCC60_07790, partial [Ilumatobacteraceae bacterium]